MNQPPKPERRWGRRILRWTGLIGCLVLSAAFCFSIRHAVVWDSPSVQYEAIICLGRVEWAWRPEGWQSEGQQYLPAPGWSTGEMGGNHPLTWWVGRGSNRHWQGAHVPLWMPFLLIAVPTAVLWYHDRRGVAQTIARWIERLRPKRQLRVSFRLAALFGIIHLLGLAVLTVGFMLLAHWFRESTANPPHPVDRIFEVVLLTLLFGAPVWVGLWTWLFVRTSNSLRDRDPTPRCATCGYNLTGNTSGQCPECGTLATP